MPHRLAVVPLGSLVSCTALGAGFDPIRVGRYSAIVPGASPEQAEQQHPQPPGARSHAHRTCAHPCTR